MAQKAVVVRFCTCNRGGAFLGSNLGVEPKIKHHLSISESKNVWASNGKLTSLLTIESSFQKGS
jgi:hypothetical protein